MPTTMPRLKREDIMCAWNMLCGDYESMNCNSYDEPIYPDWIEFLYSYKNSMEEGLFENLMQEERE